MKFTAIETLWGDQDGSITFDHSEEFHKNIQAIDAYMLTLNLTHNQRQHLADLITKMLVKEERTMALQAFEFGVQITKWGLENPDNPEAERRSLHCPVCGNPCVAVYYRGQNADIVGCDICISRGDAIEEPQCYPDGEIPEDEEEGDPQ